MNRSRAIVLVLSIAGMCSAGCENKLHDENMELYRQNRELQADNTRLKQELGQRVDPAQVSQMQQQLAERDARINDLQNQLRQPAPGQGADNSLAGIAVTRNPDTGEITVNLPGDILFDSGKADIKSSAKATLNKVVNAIKKDYGGKKVLVDGYTDTDPISRTKDQWEDNLDLSAARARTVAKYLVEQGLQRNLVGPRAFGDTKPRATKPGSRRVEIVVATR
jgi:outer membrane protein OmpA-like peptidoglycan-associated protein